MMKSHTSNGGLVCARLRGLVIMGTWLCGLAVGALLMAYGASLPHWGLAAEAAATQPQPVPTVYHPCVELEAFAAELDPLLAERAQIVRIMGRYREHMRTYPDTVPSHAVAILQHIWDRWAAHREHIAAISVPADCAPAMRLYVQSLDEFADGIESHYEYYDSAAGSEIARGIGDMYIGWAERDLVEFQRLLHDTRLRCGSAQR
jgi:hypothetical protein